MAERTSQQTSQRASIHSVGLCVKPASEEAGEAARELALWLAQRGIRVGCDPEAARWCGGEAQARAALAEKVDLLVVLGGDGTLLSVAREVASRPVPILGVNLGMLGFLAEVAPEEQQAVLERVLAGDFETVERIRLEVQAERRGVAVLQGRALNDAVIARSDLSRVIALETAMDGVPVTTYRGDGLIIATPTGSTAYTLSAGGPILTPDSRVFVLTPICPHALTQRPLVLPDSVTLEIEVHPKDGTAQLTLDGQVGVALEDGDRVRVAASRHPAHFVVSPFHSRFEVLRTKLGWGQA